MASAAAASLGYLAFGDNSTSVQKCAAEALLKVAGTKTEPLMFAVGEALCFAFGGGPPGPPHAHRAGSSADSTLVSRAARDPWQIDFHLTPEHLRLLSKYYRLTFAPYGFRHAAGRSGVTQLCVAGVQVGPDSILHTDYTSLADRHAAMEADAAAREEQAAASTPHAGTDEATSMDIEPGEHNHICSPDAHGRCITVAA